MSAGSRGIEDLPHYVHADCCPDKHFLNVNRDIKGQWTIGYVEFEGGTSVPGLALNESDTLQEAAIRMQAALERFKKRLQS